MKIKNVIVIGFTNLFICLTIVACSPFRRHAGPEVQPVPSSDVASIEEESPVKVEAEETHPEAEPVVPDSASADEGTSAFDTSLMKVAPGDPVFVLQIKDAAEALALIEGSRAWGHIRESSIWELVWTSVEMEAEVKDFQRLLRPSLSIFSHLLGQEILFVVPEFRGLLELSPTLIVQIERSDDLGKILAAAIEVALANIPEVSAREHNGYSYQVTEPMGPGLRLSFGLIDNLLVASLGESTIKAVIDRHQGESTESLANDAEFAQILARFQPADTLTDFQSVFYLDVATILEFAEMMYPMVREGMPENLQPVADGAVKWLDLVQSLAAVSNVTPEGMLSQSYTQFNPDATATNFLAMLQVPPTTQDSIQYVPADAAAYVSSNLVDLPKLWEMAMGVIESLPPETGGHILASLDMIETEFEVDIEENLFSWMGNELVLINERNALYLPREEGEPDWENVKSIPYAAVLIETTNSTLASENLKRLADLATTLLASTLGLEIEWQETDYADTLIHTAEIPEMSFQPAFAVTDKYALIAWDASFLKTILDCAAGRSETLSGLAQFQELRASAPEMVNTIAYANFSKSWEGVLDSFVEAFPAIFAEERAESEEDAAMMNAIFSQSIALAKAALQTLVGQIQYTVKDGTGLRSYSLLKMQDLDEGLVLDDPPEAQLARAHLIAMRYMDAGMPDRASQYLDRVLEIDEDHPEALIMKVELLEFEGNEKRANWYRRRLGFARESAWHVIGPFDNPDGEGFDIVYPPETALDVEATYETEWGNVTWERHQDYNENDGFMDFAERFDGEEWKVAYASTTVHSPEAREVELRIGSDDDIKVWVNGIDVLTHQVARPAEPDQDRVHVSLQQGVNQILVKVCNRELDWGFYLRFTDENRRAIKGLTYGEGDQ